VTERITLMILTLAAAESTKFRLTCNDQIQAPITLSDLISSILTQTG